VVKNLTEAAQLLLARCQAEVMAASKTEEARQDQGSKPMLSVEAWPSHKNAHVRDPCG